MLEIFRQITSNIWSLALIIVFFGGSIFVHELGHFLAARRRGLKVERFSIGFGPKIFAWHRDGVEYRVAWLPLGGYVALPQLADMRGIEGEPETDPDQLPPISYTSKMIVAVMGAVFNLLFAFLLASAIWIFGLPTTDQQTTTTVGYVYPKLRLPDGAEVPSPALDAGMQPGDRIKAIDGKWVSDWNSLLQTLVSSTGRDANGQPRAVLSLERDGQPLELEIHPRVAGEEGHRRIGITPAEPLLVAGTAPNSPAARAALRAGDRIVAVDGRPLHSRLQLQHLLDGATNRDLVFSIVRDGAPIQVTMRPVEVQYTRDGQKTESVGIEFDLPTRIIHPNPVKQFTETVVLMYRILSGLVNPRSDLSIGDMSGPPGIVRVLYATSQIDVRLVVWITILININLAIFNLLPIPVLDGGHMLFATLAKLRGRALPARLITTTQSAFMILLLSLMIFVSFKDVDRWFRDASADSRIEDVYIEPVFEKPSDR